MWKQYVTLNDVHILNVFQLAVCVEVEMSLYLRILWLAEGLLFCPLQVVLLMRNLATNLTRPEFEDHVSSCSSYWHAFRFTVGTHTVCV